MSNQKKQIILNEIAFWKQSKFLPEHYCDFLTTLYLEGNHNETLEGKSKQAVLKTEKRNKLKLAVLFPILAIVMVLLLFTIQYEWVVIAVAGGFALCCFLGAMYFAKKNAILATMLQLATALAALGVTLKICTTYFAGNNEMLYILLLINCVFWLLSGIIMRIIYFTISGVLGIVVIVGAWMYF